MSAIFLKLLNLSITAGWLILAVILVRFLLKKAPKWISCVLWALVAVRLICPFSLKSALSLIPSSETVPDNIEMMQKPAIDSGIPIVNEAVNPVIEGSFTPDPAESVKPLQTAVSVCSIVWLAGMAAMLLYALLSSARLKRSVGASVPAGGNIFVCDEVQSPFILGIARPMIYVPSSLSGKALDCVITHEKTHIRRHDHWWKPLGYLLLSIYWFNPLCWIAYVLLCRDIEMACDEKVIRNMEKDGIAEYSQALLDCSFPRKRIAVCPLAFGEVGVKERVRSVLNYKKPAFWIIIASVLACIVVGICFLTDPKDREPDTSLLNYENAGSVLSDRTYVDAIFCPPVDKNEDGQISLGYVKGIELAEYLDQVSWQEWKAPEEGLSSPGSVEFFIDTDCQITVYRKPRRAKVTYKKKVRYYKTHGGDYEEAVKLYHTRNAEPAVMKWFDSFNEDNMIWDGSREISPEEFPGVTFRWEPEKLEAVTEKETVTLCTGMPIWSVFFCDLNGDGKPELCLTVSFGSGMIDNRIEVIDYANHAFYELSDRGRYDYSLSLRMNGQLCAEKRAYMQDEILASGQLVLRSSAGAGADGSAGLTLMIEKRDPEEADQEEETEKRFSLDEGRYVLEGTETDSIEPPYLLLQHGVLNVIQNISVSYQPSGVLKTSGDEVMMETEFANEPCKWTFILKDDNVLEFSADRSVLPSQWENWKGGMCFVLEKALHFEEACSLIQMKDYNRESGLLSVCIQNSTDREFDYGELFRIYSYNEKSGSYELLKYREGIAFREILYTVAPGSEQTLELPVGFAYGTLGKGIYRLETDVTDMSTGENSTLAILFQVQ